MKKQANKKELTPVQIATAAFEKNYIHDNEIQMRVNSFTEIVNGTEKTLDELHLQLQAVNTDIDDLRRMAARKAMDGGACPEVKQFYKEMVQKQNGIVTRYNQAVEQHEKHEDLLKSYKNTSDHRYMIAWIIISSLDAEVKKAGYPEWVKKYEGKII